MTRIIPETEIVEAFRQRFPGDPAIIIAPGRINLIGEHTDYNEGFVMPAAIDKHFVFAIAANNSSRVNCFAADLREEAGFDLKDVKPGRGWIHYLMGVMHGLHQVGFPTGGVDCVFGSNIPTGAGLSSSAALCCGFGFGVSEVLGLNVSRLGLAKIAQYAEHNFAGVMCGLMDQYASLFGEKDAALLLDCQSLSHDVLPVRLNGFELLLVDSRVKHELASTAYNQRRGACEEAVAIVSKRHPVVKSLRDVSLLMLNEHQDKLGEEVFIKARYVVGEIARTQHAASLLKKDDLEGFGRLLNETHWGLSKSYDVSCDELDFLVSLTEDIPEIVAGSRMMGGGFGGCTINLVRSGKVDYLKGLVHDKYFATFGTEPEFYPVRLAKGVHRSGV